MIKMTSKLFKSLVWANQWESYANQCKWKNFDGDDAKKKKGEIWSCLQLNDNDFTIGFKVISFDHKLSTALDLCGC